MALGQDGRPALASTAAKVAHSAALTNQAGGGGREAGEGHR